MEQRVLPGLESSEYLTSLFNKSNWVKEKVIDGISKKLEADQSRLPQGSMSQTRNSSWFKIKSKSNLVSIADSRSKVSTSVGDRSTFTLQIKNPDGPHKIELKNGKKIWATPTMQSLKSIQTTSSIKSKRKGSQLDLKRYKSYEDEQPPDSLDDMGKDVVMAEIEEVDQVVKRKKKHPLLYSTSFGISKKLIRRASIYI